MNFLELKKKGKKLANKSFLVSFLKQKDIKTSFILSIPKKTGNAVLRNKLKRWAKNKIKQKKIKERIFNLIFYKKEKDFYLKMKKVSFDKDLDEILSRVQR